MKNEEIKVGDKIKIYDFPSNSSRGTFYYMIGTVLYINKYYLRLKVEADTMTPDNIGNEMDIDFEYYNLEEVGSFI